jgi:septal ring factor EnvC (AmiA/AmiB activator)
VSSDKIGITAKFKLELISNMNSKKIIEEAISNIRDDRETTRELLDDAMRYLSQDQSRHRDIGQTLAKYVETLQRSNEQLVKLCGLMSKGEKSEELTDKDYTQIFDQIQDSEEK